jgi:hypothetical protein
MSTEALDAKPSRGNGLLVDELVNWWWAVTPLLPALVGVRTPRGFLLYERRIPPPLMRPPSVLPYRSFRALVA